MRKPRTMADLLAHPAVHSVSDERRGGIANDGLWAYLAPGWIAPGTATGTVHEFTVADACAEVAAARYCPDRWAAEYGTPGRQIELLPGA